MRSISRYFAVFAIAAGLTLVNSVATLVAVTDERGSFNEKDIRVFKTNACTNDQSPIEALYYIAASRSDMAAGKPSPTSALMKEEVDKNWREITSRLTKAQVMEERFADTYNAVLREIIPILQQAVKEKSGVSIYVSEVISRLMDAAKDKEIPACGAYTNER